MKLSLGLSNTALVTKRTLNNGWISFFGALLGTIFGLMESFCSFMGTVEGIVEKFERRFLSLNNFSRVVEDRKKIFAFFDIFWKKAKYADRRVIGSTEF